jgi:phage-related protein
MNTAEAMNEWDRKAEEAQAFEKSAREHADRKLDNFSIGDVQESINWLKVMDIGRLVKAVRDGDEAEIGRIMMKGVYAYADWLGELAAEKDDDLIMLRDQCD